MERGFTLVLLCLGSFGFGVKCQRVCYGALGCFTNDVPFTFAPLGTPMLPESREVVDVEYSLFVRRRTQSTSSNDVTTTLNPVFKAVNISGPFQLSYNAKLSRKWRQLLAATKETKIIIHDYEDTNLNAWVFAMVEKFLERDDCQVITVGWTSRDEVGGYYQAAANTRVVGAEIALLLKNIKEWKSEFEYGSVHLIGHGVGAQAASYVGEIFKVEDTQCVTKQSNDDDDDSGSWWELPSWLRSSKQAETTPGPVSCAKVPLLGQITGLDPSGLWFEGAMAGARLDATDAIFVDVIHTDVIKKLMSYFGHGITRESGDIDFYPNGGYNQPGCADGVTGFEQLSYQGSTGSLQPMDCNHIRSIVYYLSTMSSETCSLTSFPCSSWQDFLGGSCTSCIHDFESESTSSIWYSYLGLRGRKRRNSVLSCLKIGPTSIQYWREHKKRAKAAKSDVTNIKAFLKTDASAPFCLKYIKIDLELAEATSEGKLSFRFIDQTNQKTGLIKVGRVSNWRSTTNPSYFVDLPASFGSLQEINILWEVGAINSWWPGIGGGSIHTRTDSRKELKLSLKKIVISQPPMTETTSFCSNRKKLRSGREVRLTPCGTEDSYDYNYDGGE